MERLEVLTSHLCVPRQWGVAARETGAREPPRFANSPEDVVVVSALRTPIGKAKRGSFKDTQGDDLLSAAFTGVLDSVGVQPGEIGDICVGNVNDPRSLFTARFAQFFSGFPETVAASTVNRACGSGLQAFMNIAGGIKNKSYTLGLAGGVEMMGTNSMSNADRFADLNPRIMETKLARECMIPMGITSETVAARYNISREQQDRFSMESHRKAIRAQVRGLFDAELIPVITKITDKNGEEKTIKVVGLFDAEIIPVTTKTTDKNGEERTIKVTKDDGVRGNTTMEALAKLKPAFKKGGTTTAGNSSQVSDGAAAVLVGGRQSVEKRGLPVLGTLRGFAVKGCMPDEMGVGPSVAIPEVLKITGLTIDDIALFEINEAFASQALYCVQKLGIPPERVNPKGGAIALGHPLGCTGARMIGTLLHEMKRRGKRGFGIVSMCMGTGMGAAAVFEYQP